MSKYLTNFALLLVLFISAASFSWQQCVPGVCNNNGGNFCSNNGPCVNETVAEHVTERLSVLNTTIPSQQFGIFSLIAVVLFSFYKACLSGLMRLLANRRKIKLKNHHYSLTRSNIYLLDLFSSGLLHPKTYLSA